MKRTGSKYQPKDLFLLKRSVGNISANETVEIIKNLGKGKHNRTYVEISNGIFTERCSVIWLGRRIK